MFQKRISQKKHWHDKDNQSLLDVFRVKRNNYVKQSRMSTRNYFKEKCSDGDNSISCAPFPTVLKCAEP